MKFVVSVGQTRVKFESIDYTMVHCARHCDAHTGVGVWTPASFHASAIALDAALLLAQAWKLPVQRSPSLSSSSHDPS